MANTNTLLKQLINADTLKGIAKATGIDANDVSSVLSQAVPALLQGANKQSSGKTAASFVEALIAHSADDTSNIAKFLKNVDVEDGAKIVSHLVGNTSTASSKIAKSTGVSAADVAKILAVAAPLVMTVLGKQTKADAKKVDANKTTALVSELLSNDDVKDLAGSLITGLIGASTGKKTSNKAGVDAADVVNLLGKLMK